ncbi:MAG: hypothetical protein SGI90_13660 [Candidatus Eisenbacteria bacterium]|nr:hypothetical protein [Candidatus Eisenbacteria bacterium]
MNRLLIALAFLLAALLSCRQLGSADLGFHLKTGEYILSGHGWPQTDPFTDTMKDHAYIDTSWGFDVLVAQVHRLTGPAGLTFLTMVLTLAILALITMRARLNPKLDELALTLGLLMATIAMELRYEPRPEMISYALLALQTYLLSRRAVGRPTPAWLFVIVQLIWANTHSLFILGWLVLLIYVVGGWLETKKFDRGLALALVAAIAVSFVNPYGFEGVRFPFTLLTRFQSSNPFAQSIGEFISPFSVQLSQQFPNYPAWPLWTFCILMALTALAAVTWLRKKQYTALLLALAFAPLGVRMTRNIPLAVIIVLPALIAAMPIGRWIERRWQHPILRRALPVAAIVAAIVLSLRVFHDAYYLDTRRTDRIGVGWNRLILPVEAAAFANKVNMPGAMLNHLNFGGYLMWATKGPVFIDGRLEVVGESFFNDYGRILSSEVALEQAVARHGIGWIVTPYAGAPELIRRLSADPRWRLAHVDGLAAVFLRVDRADVRDRVEGMIDPRLGALLAPGPPSIPWNQLPEMGGPPRPGAFARWADGLFRRQQFPGDDFYIGLFCYFRKEYEPAARRFTEAIRSSHGAWYDAYANLGSVLWRNGDKAGATAAYEVVLREDPLNKVALERVGEQRK